eukprot:scaffold172614_cov18-Tisochrysis_lutea.AAC.1
MASDSPRHAMGVEGRGEAVHGWWPLPGLETEGREAFAFAFAFFFALASDLMKGWSWPWLGADGIAQQTVHPPRLATILGACRATELERRVFLVQPGIKAPVTCSLGTACTTVHLLSILVCGPSAILGIVTPCSSLKVRMCKRAYDILVDQIGYNPQ